MTRAYVYHRCWRRATGRSGSATAMAVWRPITTAFCAMRPRHSQMHSYCAFSKPGTELSGLFSAKAISHCFVIPKGDGSRRAPNLVCRLGNSSTRVRPAMDHFGLQHFTTRYDSHLVPDTLGKAQT